jgi:hypothetical protein
MSHTHSSTRFKRSKFAFFCAIALALCLMLAAAAGKQRPALRIPADPAFRAIFCGVDGTETSAAYARALSRDLRVLAAAGLSSAAGLAVVEAEACGAGSKQRLAAMPPG